MQGHEHNADVAPVSSQRACDRYRGRGAGEELPAYLGLEEQAQLTSQERDHQRPRPGLMSQAAEQTPSPPSWTSRSGTTGRLWQGGSHGPGWVWRASAQQSHPMQDTRAQVRGRGRPHRGQPGWGPEHELEGRQESGASVGQLPLDERLRSWEWGGDFIEKASRHHLQQMITMTITGKRTMELTSCPETWGGQASPRRYCQRHIH